MYFSRLFSRFVCLNKNITISLSAEEDVEELELELHSRLLMLCKEHLIELFDKFEISKETLQNKTKLQLAKLLFSVVEKELGKLKTEEIIPYLKDFIQTVPGSDPVEISAKLDETNSDAPKIKQLEKEVEALKIKQKNELELALSKLEAARGEMGRGSMSKQEVGR